MPSRDRRFLDHVLDCIQRVAPVTSRSMFGGHGIYLDGVMFALIADDTLYLKTGEANRDAFTAAGMGPFVYEAKGQPIRMSYYELPPDVLEDPGALAPWIAAAHHVAVQAKQARRPRTSKRR